MAKANIQCRIPVKVSRASLSAVLCTLLILQLPLSFGLRAKIPELYVCRLQYLSAVALISMYIFHSSQNRASLYAQSHIAVFTLSEKGPVSKETSHRMCTNYLSKFAF